MEKSLLVRAALGLACSRHGFEVPKNPPPNPHSGREVLSKDSIAFASIPLPISLPLAPGYRVSSRFEDFESADTSSRLNVSSGSNLHAVIVQQA